MLVLATEPCRTQMVYYPQILSESDEDE